MSSTVYGVGPGISRLPAEVALPSNDVPISAVSWAAIIAGGFASLAATLILLVLGAGIGLSMVSPWYGAGASAATVGVSAVIWLVIVQWISSGVGGFIAGRLRTAWTGVHTHEVFFRDTAHGFLVWSLASVAGAMMFATVTAAGVGGAGTAAVAAAASAQSNRTTATAFDNGRATYFTDSLYRSNTPAADRGVVSAETVRIFANNLQDGQIVLSDSDRTYIAQLVAARTGVSQGEAEQRVDTVVQQLNNAAQRARAAADKARKRAAQLSVVGALAMLIGAFIASAAAAVGGSIRDEY